jgi:hypothetical protein
MYVFTFVFPPFDLLWISSHVIIDVQSLCLLQYMDGCTRMYSIKLSYWVFRLLSFSKVTHWTSLQWSDYFLTINFERLDVMCKYFRLLLHITKSFTFLSPIIISQILINTGKYSSIFCQSKQLAISFLNFGRFFLLKWWTWFSEFWGHWYFFCENPNHIVSSHFSCYISTFSLFKKASCLR